MQLLPREAWVIEPVLAHGAPTGFWIVGAWAQDGDRGFAVCSPAGPIAAHKDGPPDPPWPIGLPIDFEGLDVIDLVTGLPVSGVTCIDTAEGWLVRLMTDEADEHYLTDALGQAMQERREGRFQLRS